MANYESYDFRSKSLESEKLKKIKELSQEDMILLLNALSTGEISISNNKGIELEQDKMLENIATNILKCININSDYSFDKVYEKLSVLLSSKEIDILVKKLNESKNKKNIIEETIDSNELETEPIIDEVKPMKKKAKSEKKKNYIHIRDKILDAGVHVVLCREITYSEYINNCSQIEIPVGYKIVAINKNDDLISSNYVVFENKVPVKVKVYRKENGEEFSPEFGTPIE